MPTVSGAVVKAGAAAAVAWVVAKSSLAAGDLKLHTSAAADGNINGGSDELAGSSTHASSAAVYG